MGTSYNATIVEQCTFTESQELGTLSNYPDSCLSVCRFVCLSIPSKEVAWFYYQLNWGVWNDGIMGTCELGNLGTWEIKNLEIRSLGTWELGNLETWELGTWKLGNLGT